MVKLEDHESQKKLLEDDDDEIPEAMLPFIDEEVDFVKDFIEEEVTRRLKKIEDQEIAQKIDDETKRSYEEQKEKMIELEKKMRIIHEKDERLKKYIAEKRLNAEKSDKEKKKNKTRMRWSIQKQIQKFNQTR